ncbi:Uma2 family endonuclease [Acaryochloris sp. IP29b_bin.148]|uniref:Uma2 family endonuclease n=1 Tax=Acaryochloris sp. IP29b_bin.148 TaxID=2969218 RepID=UPI0026117679|nr:Uma2 family endonuclease [Acaryochloris sp. IP29b_bin.148]
MTESASPQAITSRFPDHTQLPETDGTFVKNFQEHPQSLLLTDSLSTTLRQLHPDGQYCIGQDCGIYWRETEPAEQGAVAPDWFYVPHVPPKLNNQIRRSYVLWREYIAPAVVLEFASGSGSEERDQTPFTGKFWVYEKIIRVPYYGIYEINSAKLEVYELVGGQYQQLSTNDRGHYPIPPLQVELGLWQGHYQNQEGTWLRWWTLAGELLLIGNERASQAEAKMQQLGERLRAMGVDPEAEGLL